jgi:hypothetical protein
MTTSTVTVPYNVHLTVDQLVVAVRQLEPEGRAKIAQALLSKDMDERLSKLIQRLAKKPPVTDISDEDINEEVRAVRRARRNP